MEISFLPWPASHCPPSHSLIHSWVVLQVLGCDKRLVFGSGWCLPLPNINSDCGPGDAGSCLWKAERPHSSAVCVCARYCWKLQEWNKVYETPALAKLFFGTDKQMHPSIKTKYTRWPEVLRRKGKKGWLSNCGLTCDSRLCSGREAVNLRVRSGGGAGRGNCDCGGLRAELGLGYLRNSEVADVAERSKLRGQNRGSARSQAPVTGP